MSSKLTFVLQISGDLPANMARAGGESVEGTMWAMI